MLRLQTLKVQPANPLIVSFKGNYVRVETAAVPLWIATENGDRFLLDEGEEAVLEDFTRLELSHDDAAEQTIRLFVGDGQARVGSAKVSGVVTVASGNLTVVNFPVEQATATTASAPVNTAKTVTSSSTTILTANPARRFLMIQNKSAVGRVWLRFGAFAATQLTGWLLEPGEEYAASVVFTGEIRAIGDMASNPDVLVIEG